MTGYSMRTIHDISKDTSDAITDIAITYERGNKQLYRLTLLAPSYFEGDAFIPGVELSLHAESARKLRDLLNTYFPQ
jgi:hypothetical protein